MCKMSELDPYLTPHTKIHSKGVIDLNVRMKTTKLLEESTGANFCDFSLDSAPKAQTIKENE